MEHFIFKPGFIVEVIPTLLSFLPVTLFITVASALLGLLLGAALACGKLARGRFPRLIAAGYTTVMRCTPAIVLMFVVYYGLPLVLIDLFRIDIQSLPNLFFAVISLSLLFAATSSELMRSAYEAVDRGQREAALTIGLSRWQAFYRIVLPQCAKMIVPNLALSVVALMKEASLAFTIGVVDLIGKANLVISNNYNAMSLETFLAVALIYWVLSFLIQRIVSIFERRGYGGQLGHTS